MANDTQQSGLDSLPIRPKSQVEMNAETLATAPNSSEILKKMQDRVDELTSPWHGFQSALDDMVARARNNPEANLQQRAQQRQQEQQEIQNLGLTLAQTGMMRNQLGNVRSGFQAPGQAPQGQTQQGQQMDPSQPSGAMYKGIPLSNMEYQTLQNYVSPDGSINDLSGFNAAFKAISDIHSRAENEPANWTSGPGVISGYDANGNYHNFGGNYTAREIKDWETKGIVPGQLRGFLVSRDNPKIQKKANGGAIRALADGGDPMQAPVATQDVSPPVMPGSGMQGGMLDTALSSLMGTAQAAPKASVSTQFTQPVIQKGPVIERTTDPTWTGREQQSGLQQGEQQNSAELESLKQEREAAGKFIADLQNQSFNPTTLQKSQEIIDMVKKHPEYFGYGQKNDPIGVLMGLTGVQEDNKTSDDATKNVSRLVSIKEHMQGEDAMEQRNRLNQLGRELGIAYEKEQFGGTGSKMGAQLTSISQAAKGLGANFPASQNIEQAITLQNVHLRNSELAKEWNDYKHTVRNPDPYEFMMSPKTQGIINKWNLKLNSDVDSIRNRPTDGTRDTDAKGNEIIWQNGKPMRVKK